MASKILDETQQPNENQNFEFKENKKRSSLESNKSILDSVKTDENEDTQTISDKNICDISNDTLKYIFVENDISTKDSSPEKNISHHAPYFPIGWTQCYEKYSYQDIYFDYNLYPKYNCYVFEESKTAKNGQIYFGKNKNVGKLNENAIYNFYTSTENYFKELSPDKNNYIKTKNFKPKEKSEPYNYNIINDNSNKNNSKPLKLNYNNYNHTFSQYDKYKRNKFDNTIDSINNFFSNITYYNNNNYYYDNYNTKNNNSYYYPKKKEKFVERNGDWVCGNCKNLNFAFRKECNRCQTRKGENKENKEKIEIKENIEIKEHSKIKLNNIENKEIKENSEKTIEKVQNDEKPKITKKEIKNEINEFLPIKKSKNKKRKNKLKSITK